MEQRTIEILQVLVALCRSANFTCDVDGARKITIAINTGEALIKELLTSIADDEIVEENSDE